VLTYETEERVLVCYKSVQTQVLTSCIEDAVGAVPFPIRLTSCAHRPFHPFLVPFPSTLAVLRFV
jgi:hypothetical protein